jgi:cell division protein FtsB
MAVGTASPARGLGAARGAARRVRPAQRASLAHAGVRWDRVGRVALLFVLAALLYLYLSAGIHMLSKWSQDRRVSAAVVALKREHTLLVRQHEALGRQATLESEARQLGMIKPGEQPFIAAGLPNN